MSADPDHSLPRSAQNLIADFLSIPREESRSRRRPTLPLSGLVDQLMTKHQIGCEAPEHVIREHWKLIAGSNAHYSHPLQIDPRGQLIVLTSHAVVRNELFMHRALIVENIRKLPGCSHVRAIHIRSG